MRTAILFLANLGCAFGRLIIGPQNAAIIAGERMSMECRMDEESRVRKWDLLDVNRETTTVYAHSTGIGLIHPKFPHFGVQVNANGSGILYANSTKMDDAGSYTCIAKLDLGNKDDKFSAQLIVFESEPKCETNFTRNDSESLSVGDSIWMRCSIVFRGFWTPTLEWTQHWKNGETGIEGPKVTAGVEVVQIPSNKTTSTLSITINSSANHSYFSCKISFADYDSKGFDTTATNLPDFNYTWDSDVIQLAYSPVSYAVTVPSSDTTFDGKAPSSADTRSFPEEPGRYFAMFMVVAGLSLFLVLVVIVAIAFCIHYKRKVSAKLSTSSALDSAKAGEKPSTPTALYDIIPYALGDQYETIDETEIKEIATADIQRRTPDPHASEGYSKLLSTQPTPPAVYSRMDRCKRPGNADHIGPNTNETNISGADEDSPSEKNTSLKVAQSPPYLELTDVSTNRYLVDEKLHPCRNIKPTANDALDENVIGSSNSNSESPIPYINVNYETPQLPSNQVQGSPPKTSAYTTLLSTGEIQQISPHIPAVDSVTKGVRILPKPPPPRKV